MKHAWTRASRLAAAMLLVVSVAACAGKSSRDRSGEGAASGGSAGSDGARGGTAGTDAGTGGGAAIDCDGYCDDLSRCENLSPEGCRFTCRSDEGDSRDLGCLAEYENVIDCFFANDLCGFSAGMCESEMSAYARCASLSESILCATVCEREGQCQDTFPAHCLAMCGKDARLLAERGCSPEHDAYLTCAMSHADPCDISSTGCAAEDEATVRCALN